jgi:hypothetical protein
MQDEIPHYYHPDAFVYTSTRAFELADIWRGIDRLERRSVSLDQIGRRLSEDWESAVIVLAQLGRPKRT